MTSPIDNNSQIRPNQGNKGEASRSQLDFLQGLAQFFQAEDGIRDNER
eukprot:COSAG02_NODE_6645_length_3438_cov_1.337526_4_plen_48_part_00